MKSVEHLLEFIKSKLSREEQIYLAAQIQIEIYKNQLGSTAEQKLVKPTINEQPVIQGVDIAPSNSVQTVEQAEHVGLFTSKDGKDIQFSFLTRKALSGRPKTIEKLRNFISTTCNGYGGLKPSDLEIVLSQIQAGCFFTIEEDGTLIWNSN